MVEMPSGYYYFGGYDMSTKEITVLMVETAKEHGLVVSSSLISSLTFA